MIPSEVPEFAKATHPAGKLLVIGKSSGYSDDEIGGLPAIIDHSEARFPAILSYWKPSKEELALLNEGAYIQLEVIAYQMVPVEIAFYRVISKGQPGPQTRHRSHFVTCPKAQEVRERVKTRE